jgi:AcrR family transcriptional regulator
MGRPAVLDVDRVVVAAVALADEHGISGVTLPKVADALGVTPMSLYRHVGSKAELLELMRDQAGGPAPAPDGPAPDSPDRDWRTGLRRWAHAQRAMFERHPWLAQLPVTGPPAGPNAVSWMETCFRALAPTGLSWGDKLAVLSLLAGFVRSASLTRHQLAEGRRDSGLDQAEAERAYGMALVSLVDPQVYPETAALFRSPVFAGGDDGVGGAENVDPDFWFGLELILDGVAAVIARG